MVSCFLPLPLPCFPSQMFFDVNLYIAFVEACRAAGIKAPIVPGIMLIMNEGGFGRMTKFCKTRVPAELQKRIDDCGGDAAKVRAVGIEVGAEMSRELLAAGAPVLHYYTLNLEKVTERERESCLLCVVAPALSTSCCCLCYWCFVLAGCVWYPGRAGPEEGGGRYCCCCHQVCCSTSRSGWCRGR